MRRLIAVPTVLLALAAAGCGAGDDADATTSATTSSGTGAGPDEGDPPDPGDSPAPDSSPVPGQPVSCGEIPDALGKARNVALFADPGAGGTVGCEEAHDVMAEFFLRAPQAGGGSEGTLAVRGWFCQYESGPTGTWVTSCRKDTLEMHTEEPSGQTPAPDPTEEPGEPGEPGESPEESQLPPIPEDPGDPLDEPSNEEL
ncbi:hypothetical protein [Streptomyces sp. NPDC048248]|uniref:hypothetical protein n=1 Tax=Streptomyces sp. NPDC048248 TaxID=3365523 RepID=UPI003722D14B